MNAPRLLLTLASATLLALLPVRAAVVVHEYALRGTLNDSVGSTPLTALGGQVTALGYVFAPNQGLSLSSPSLSPFHYSLEFSVKLDTVAGNRKLIDFRNLSSNSGLYVSNGMLGFQVYDATGPAIFGAGSSTHVVFSRNVNGTVSGYINGQLSFAFFDSNLHTLHNGTLGFFVDDVLTNQTEASGGTVNYMRFYNGALTQSEVTAIFNAGAPLSVPEPSTCALLSVGGIVLAASAWRRRRR